MEDTSIPQTETQMLEALWNSDNPTELLSNLFDEADQKEDARLRRLLKSLSNQGCIRIPMWADNKPYHVELFESVVRPEHRHPPVTISDDHSVHIGSGAKITRSIIGDIRKTSGAETGGSPPSFYERHPIVCSLVISLSVGFVLLFSFWKNIVDAIEGLFQ